MAFGLSLDHYNSLPSRHTLYEEEEEEEGEREEERDLFYFTPEIPIQQFNSVQLLIPKQQPVTSLKCHNLVKVLKGRYFHKEKENEEGQEAVICEIYQVKERSNVMIALLTSPLKDEYCNEWSRKILNFINRPQKVVILHSLQLHQYFLSNEEREKGEDERDKLLRSLQTSTWTEESLAPLLNPSNFISGESAAVLSHCQVSSIPGSLVALYASTELTMTEQVTSLRPLFTAGPLHNLLPLRSLKDADVQISSVLPRQRTDMNTLYT